MAFTKIIRSRICRLCLILLMYLTRTKIWSGAMTSIRIKIGRVIGLAPTGKTCNCRSSQMLIWITWMIRAISAISKLESEIGRPPKRNHRRKELCNFDLKFDQREKTVPNTCSLNLYSLTLIVNTILSRNMKKTNVTQVMQIKLVWTCNNNLARSALYER
jgi:hypothetical protein